jgi:hypothetical protein
MITLNVVGDVISGSFGGEHFGITFDQDIYDQMLKLQAEANAADTVKELKAIIERFTPLTVEDFKATIEGASEYLHYNEKTGETFLKYNKVVSNVPMPQGFVDRLNESIEKNIDILPMIKFWIRTLRNPKLNPVKLGKIINYINATYVDTAYAEKLMDEHGVSYEVAVERATRIQVPITQEGLLQTYKVSREKLTKFDKATGDVVDRYVATWDEESGLKSYDEPEFAEDRVFEPVLQGDRHDAFTCGDKLGHIIKVGEVHALPEWSMVNCDDSRSCVGGLHVGNLDYIRGYQNEGTVTHNVFVDPMFIGAVPNDHTGAIRCKEYMVYDTFAGPTKSLYRSSEYASKTDIQWQDLLQKAVQANVEFAAKVAEDVANVTEQLGSLDI